MAADRAAQDRLAARFQGWLDVPLEQARIAALGRDARDGGVSLTERSAQQLSRFFGMDEATAARAALLDRNHRCKY